MNQEDKEFLRLKTFPAMLNTQQVAQRLGVNIVEVAILSGAGKLTPLGKPKRNAKKVYANIEIEKCIHDLDWLNRAQKTIADFWEKKNRSRRTKSASAPIHDSGRK